jgi:hypothetical protein
MDAPSEYTSASNDTPSPGYALALQFQRAGTMETIAAL